MIVYQYEFVYFKFVDFIDWRSSMKLKNDFTLREIAGDYIVIPTGENYLDFGAVVSLNESGAFLWKQLEDERSFEELCDMLMQEYGIDAELAETDVADFITLLKEHGLVCDE